MVKTRIGILGYGNLGRGVELACRQNDDLELVALFTRRDPASVHPLADSVTVYAADDLAGACRRCGRARPLRRQRERPARADARMRPAVYRGRFVRHAREHPRPFRAGGRSCAGRRPRWPSSLRGGIRACSRSRACTRAASCPKAATTRSGVVAFPKATATPSAAFPAWPMRASTRCRCRKRSKPCAAGRCPNCPRARSIRANATWWPKKVPTWRPSNAPS